MGFKTVRTARQAYDVRKESIRTGLKCTDKSMAVQSAKDDADINVIVKRFKIGAALPQNVRAPTFGDFTEVGDFQSAHNALLSARDSFMKMEASVRARFDNSPHLFVAFCSDPANLPEMRKLGLAVPEVVPPVVPVVTPPA